MYHSASVASRHERNENPSFTNKKQPVRPLGFIDYRKVRAADLIPREKAVLEYVANTSFATGMCFASTEEMLAPHRDGEQKPRIRMSRATLARVLRSLREAGLIEVWVGPENTKSRRVRRVIVLAPSFRLRPPSPPSWLPWSEYTRLGLDPLQNEGGRAGDAGPFEAPGVAIVTGVAQKMTTVTSGICRNSQPGTTPTHTSYSVAELSQTANRDLIRDLRKEAGGEPVDNPPEPPAGGSAPRDGAAPPARRGGWRKAAEHVAEAVGPRPARREPRQPDAYTAEDFSFIHQALCALLAAQIGAEAVESWFRPLRVKEKRGHILRLEADNKEVAEYLQRAYGPEFRECIRKIDPTVSSAYIVASDSR